MNREYVAMGRVPFVLSLDVETVIENLDLDAAEEWDSRRGDRRAPDKYSRIAPAAQVAPLHFKNKVLVLPISAHRAGRMSGAMNHSVANAPGFGRAVGVYPTTQIAPVKEGNKSFLVSRKRNGCGGQEENQRETFHVSRLTSLSI